MDLQQLQYLVTIHELGTISQAAKALDVSQPAISTSIQRLEEELGVILFDRTGNSVALNDVGLMVIEYAKNILKEVSKMYRGIESYNLNLNQISIASCAHSPLWGLKQLYKDTECPFILAENTADLIVSFNNNEYALLILDFSMERKDLVCIPFIEEQLFLAVKPDDPLATLQEVSFSDINGYNLLVLNEKSYWKEIIQYGLSDSLIIYEDQENYSTLQEITSLPVFRTNITKHQYHDDRIYIPITDFEATLTYYIHYHKRDHQFDSLQEQIKTISWDHYTKEDQ